MSNRKTIVYVDGFNLYYGALKRSNYKWLNLEKLFDTLLVQNDVVKIKYFTAKLKVKSSSQGPRERQSNYLRALATLKRVQVITGSFVSRPQEFHRVHPVELVDGTIERKVMVTKNEEKGSDVNLASHMLMDASNKQLDLNCVALVSNDTDFELPFRFVKQRYKKFTVLISPRQENSWLEKDAGFSFKLNPEVLKDCLFPNKMKDKSGVFYRPREW